MKHICHSLYCDLQLSTQIVKPSISWIFTKIWNLKLKISIFPPFVNIFFNVKAIEIVYCTLATSFINFYTQFYLVNFFHWQIKVFYTRAKKNLINPPTFSHFPYNTNFKLLKKNFPATCATKKPHYQKLTSISHDIVKMKPIFMLTNCTYFHNMYYKHDN